MPELPDLSHPDTFADGFPHALFRELRRSDPVAWQEGDYCGGPGYWIVSRYDTIVSISRRPQLFSSASGTAIEDSFDFVSLIGMDPPGHRRYRALVSAGFTPRRIAAKEARHREIVRSILDGVVERGACDFVVDVAAQLPLRVIAELLGVPQSAAQDLFDWSNRMIGNQDPEYSVSLEEAAKAAQEMFAFANAIAEERLREPKDDLISALLHGEVAGERLGTVEFDAFFLLLAVAGNETTRNLISQGLLLLLEHPDALARLRRDPSRLPGAIEEMLRFRSPVYYMKRTALRDTELEGKRARKVDKLLMYYPSAARDPRDLRGDPRAHARARARRPGLLPALEPDRRREAHPAALQGAAVPPSVGSTSVSSRWSDSRASAGSMPAASGWSIRWPSRRASATHASGVTIA
jgi:cholest-4-en-3-one 26-monooxygenase